MHNLVWGFWNNWQNDDKRIPFYPLIWEKFEKTMTHWPSNQFIFQNFSLPIANSLGSWVLQNTRLLHFMWNISIFALYLHNKTHFIIFVPNFLLRVLNAFSAWIHEFQLSHEGVSKVSEQARERSECSKEECCRGRERNERCKRTNVASDRVFIIGFTSSLNQTVS